MHLANWKMLPHAKILQGFPEQGAPCVNCGPAVMGCWLCSVIPAAFSDMRWKAEAD